jgi:MFS family permease
MHRACRMAWCRPRSVSWLRAIAVRSPPVVGPTLGGWLADNISWRWCFLINVPVGVFATAAIATLLREPPEAAAEHRTSGRLGTCLRCRDAIDHRINNTRGGLFPRVIFKGTPMAA